MYKLLIAVLVFFQSSIYNLHFTDADGKQINFSSFGGKKMLLVNIASGSPAEGQLAALEQLQERYKDSLVVIVFPSNSFGREALSSAGIRKFCQDKYHASFLIAAKGSVKGTDIQPVYNWLTSQNENGSVQGDVQSDFQKYLIDRQGNIVGVFDASVVPVSQVLLDAIGANE